MELLNKVRGLKERVKNREYRYLLKRLFPGGNPVFYSGKQLIMRLSEPRRFEKVSVGATRRCSYEIIPLDQNGLEELCRAFPQKEEKFRRRMARGNGCYIARKDGCVAGYAWFLDVEGNDFLTNSMWRLRLDKKDGLWMFDVFVEPAHRMRGLFVCLLSKVYDESKSRGYETLYGEVFYTNEASTKAHLRVGYEILKEVKFYSILGLKIYIVTDPHRDVRPTLEFRYSLNVKKYKL